MTDRLGTFLLRVYAGLHLVCLVLGCYIGLVTVYYINQGLYTYYYLLGNMISMFWLLILAALSKGDLVDIKVNILNRRMKKNEMDN